MCLGQNVTSLSISHLLPTFWCPNATVSASLEKPKTCHHSQVSVPIPFECDIQNSLSLNCHHGKYKNFNFTIFFKTPTLCISVENILESSKFKKIDKDGNRFFNRHFTNDCLNDTTTYSKSGHWKIELNSMTNVYAVLIRTLGQAGTVGSLYRINKNGFL